MTMATEPLMRRGLHDEDEGWEERLFETEDEDAEEDEGWEDEDDLDEEDDDLDDLDDDLDAEDEDEL